MNNAMCWQQQILEQTSRRLKQPTTAAVVLGLPRFAISEQAELAELQKNAKIRCDVKMQRDGVKMKRYGFLCTF
jgi:precorrin isomerase